MLIYAAVIVQLHMLETHVKLDYFVCEVVNLSFRTLFWSPDSCHLFVGLFSCQSVHLHFHVFVTCLISTVLHFKHYSDLLKPRNGGLDGTAVCFIRLLLVFLSMLPSVLF